MAEILANTPVGGPAASHYLLQFRAPEPLEIVPPQFLMMDTAPIAQDTGPYLKRPFGIYRAHYRRGSKSAVSYDVLYKVLPDGLGTNLMTGLKRGDKIHMLAPLGQPLDVRPLRAAGFEEVHIIGGGVGMAPLVMLVAMLRVQAFRVKVFLGIATMDWLRYREELTATFGETPRDALLYIDDLLAAGMMPGDIFISCDSASPKPVRKIPKINLYHGLVPDQYRRFLNQRAPSKAMAITCGPNRMMEMMSDICQRAGVPLKVLLEKRMGCGMGVCFSCVQHVRRPDGSEDYARVCTEGPLFDAKDILWNNNDSKQLSASCGCAARC